MPFNSVYIHVNPVSFLNVLPLMPPTSLFRKYHMHPAMLLIWYNYKFYININAIHMQHWTKYRSVSYTYVESSVLHLQCCVVYETVMDSISLWLIEIWVLWDVMVSGEWFSLFQKIIVPSSSIVKAF